MHLSRSLVAALLLVTLGCAPPAKRSPSSRGSSVETLADGSQIVCTMERPTGSHIPEQVCRKVPPKGGDGNARAHSQSQLAIPRSGAQPPVGTP